MFHAPADDLRVGMMLIIAKLLASHCTLLSHFGTGSRRTKFYLLQKMRAENREARDQGMDSSLHSSQECSPSVLYKSLSIGDPPLNTSNETL